jgi:hypothetical protein
MNRTRQRFAEGWSVYLRAHSKPTTRAAHYVATAFGLVSGVSGLVLLDPWLIAAAVVGGYGIAVSSHYVFEKNHPLVFPHPLMSICFDLWMCSLAATGRLAAELARHGIQPTRA